MFIPGDSRLKPIRLDDYSLWLNSVHCPECDSDTMKVRSEGDLHTFICSVCYYTWKQEYEGRGIDID